jgi:hypothetical protein
MLHNVSTVVSHDYPMKEDVTEVQYEYKKIAVHIV